MEETEAGLLGFLSPKMDSHPPFNVNLGTMLHIDKSRYFPLNLLRLVLKRVFALMCTFCLFCISWILNSFCAPDTCFDNSCSVMKGFISHLRIERHGWSVIWKSWDAQDVLPGEEDGSVPGPPTPDRFLVMLGDWVPPTHVRVGD